MVCGCFNVAAAEVSGQVEMIGAIGAPGWLSQLGV